MDLPSMCKVLGSIPSTGEKWLSPCPIFDLLPAGLTPIPPCLCCMPGTFSLQTLSPLPPHLEPSNKSHPILNHDTVSPLSPKLGKSIFFSGAFKVYRAQMHKNT